MEIRFYVDPATDEPHIYGHRVSEEEAIDVLETPGEDRPGQDGVRVAIGQTQSGRFAGDLCSRIGWRFRNHRIRIDR